MDDQWFNSKKHSVFIAILVVASFFLLMFGNGIVSLTHPDEVFYIQSAKEMVKYNSWFTPMIFDEIQFEKPFLSFALFGLALKFFGENPWSARFWPAFFGILGVCTVYWIAWTLFKRKRLAFLAGMILASSFIHIALSRAVLTDMIFTVFVTISIAFFATGYYDRRYRQTGIIMWWVVAAIAVLTKGILGLIFPVATALVFLIYKKDLRFLKCPATLWGILAFCALALPWHIVMYIRHGSWFLEEYFYNVHWRRVLMAEHARLDNWYFYILLMFGGVMPWFLIWIPACREIYRQFKNKLSSREKLFFLLGWIASVYVVLQPAHCKLASYIFPSFPAIAILLAYAVNEALVMAEAGETPKLFKLAVYLTAVFLVVIAVGGPIAARIYSGFIPDMSPVYFTAGSFAVLAIVISVLNWKGLYLQTVLCFVGIAAIFLTGLFHSKSFIEPWISCKDIVEVFKTYDQSDTPILSSKFYVRGVRYYTGRPVAVIDPNSKGFWSPHPIPFLKTDGKVIAFLNHRPVTWAILKEGNVKDIKRILMRQKYKITEYEGIGGKYILKIEKIS